MLRSLPLVVLAAGCSSFQEDVPPVPDSLMVEVFADLHLADARADAMADVPPGVRDSVLAHHGLDSVRYAEALSYYADHPQAFSTLYGEVVDRLSADRAFTAP